MKLSQMAIDLRKPRKFNPAKVKAYTVFKGEIDEFQSLLKDSVPKMHLTGAIHGVLTVSLVILCEAIVNTPVNNCVSDYEDFENKTFSNKENRYKLYEVFYPPNRHLPYAVELTYQAMLLNGTEINITSSDDFCSIVHWRWIASPLFLFIEPDILDALVLYTLNYFRAWTTPSVILHVPYPCTNNTVTFLARMTSLVSWVLTSL